MEENEEFLTQLKNAGAVRSLELEFEVGSVVQELGWEVSRGVFVDPIEQKPREIDVRGRQIWTKPSCWKNR